MTRATQRSRAGRAVLGPLFFLALVLAALYLGRELDRHATAQGFALVEPGRVRLELEGAAEGWSDWLDPRWAELLAERLAAVPEFQADDPAGVEAVVAALAELSFIEQLGPAHVVWPDGLEVPLRLRRPVACVAWDGRFYPVAVDWNGRNGPRGVLLPGGDLTPPAFGGGFLPVLGGLEGVIDRVWLEQPALVAALSVADSLWQHLDGASVAALGRPVIDASRDHLASVEEPGTRLELEGGRIVWFGRAPSQGAPGERSVAAKWASLAEALRQADGGRAWTVADLRWDQLVLLPAVDPER